MTGAENGTGSSMTLRRLLELAVSGLLLLLLLGTLSSNLYNLRQYMQAQLQSHAQDAATSLGLSLSTAVDASDLAVAGSMINAIFDSGYYQRIILADRDGRPLLVRESDMELEGVPGWFVSWIDLSAPEGTADVMSGWNQLGSVSVVSHPGVAYRDLWQLIRAQLIWFLVTAVLGYLVVRAVVYMILQPLNRIEAQANAIRQRDFGARAPLPRTSELRQVAIAMNDMAERLEQIQQEQLTQIEELREQTYRDSLTGLSNRLEFDKRLQTYLQSEPHFAVGSLLLLQVGNFTEFNQEFGRAEGDNLLWEVAQELRRSSERVVGALVARRTGADFAIYLPGVMEEQGDRFADDLLKRLAGLPAIKKMCRNDVLHIGMASSLHQREGEALLAEADVTLRKAQASGPNGWQRYWDADREQFPEQHAYSASEWLGILRQVLAERSLRLYFQPVFSLDRQTVLHHQVLSRIEVAGRTLVAGLFLPMAKRFGLSKEFDQLVLELLLQHLAQRSQSEERYALSLSPTSLTERGFVDWLQARLEQQPQETRRLVLEVPEYALHYSQSEVEQLVSRAGELGYQVAIDRFGATAVPFGYLQHLSIQFIKIDQSFIRDLHQSRDNQFFLRSVLQIARGLGVQVVAMGVEFEEEWSLIEQLGFDGAMGYYLCRPQATPWEPES